MRDRDQVIWDFVQEWLRKAEADLRAAQHLLTLEQDDYFTSAFHAQQAAEKFLKAFLVRHQIPFPKSHDIAQLLKLTATIEPVLSQLLARATSLTPFGVDFRYPGDQVSDRRTAQSAIREARQVRTVIRRLLRGYLQSGRPSA